jgi:predicted Rossmann-fold nucleotide-binding protein
MKVVLITGGRDYDAWESVNRALTEEDPDLVIQGGADGADSLASYWVRENAVMELRMPARWKKHGKFAGPKRNEAMVKMAVMFDELGHDVMVVAFPGGRGTADCLERAERADLAIRRVKS